MDKLVRRKLTDEYKEGVVSLAGDGEITSFAFLDSCFYSK